MMKAMEKVCLLMAACLCFAFIISLGTAFSQAERSEIIQPDKKIAGSQIIRLHYIGGINPETATVKPGTTVIWINEAQSPVEIQFTGKQVNMACQNPVHFITDDKGSFISDEIPLGAVASLCFIEKGEFNYVVRRSHKPNLAYRESPKEFKGNIIVK